MKKCICVIWCFGNKQGNNAKATAKKICSIFGKGLISDLKVRNWFAKFCFGDTTLKNESKAGRLSNLDENLLKAILEQNLHQLTRDIAGRLYHNQLFAATWKNQQVRNIDTS